MDWADLGLGVSEANLVRTGFEQVMVVIIVHLLAARIVHWAQARALSAGKELHFWRGYDVMSTSILCTATLVTGALMLWMESSISVTERFNWAERKLYEKLPFDYRGWSEGYVACLQEQDFSTVKINDTHVAVRVKNLPHSPYNIRSKPIISEKGDVSTWSCGQYDMVDGKKTYIERLFSEGFIHSKIYEGNNVGRFRVDDDMFSLGEMVRITFNEEWRTELQNQIGLPLVDPHCYGPATWKVALSQGNLKDLVWPQNRTERGAMCAAYIIDRDGNRRGWSEFPTGGSNILNGMLREPGEGMAPATTFPSTFIGGEGRATNLTRVRFAVLMNRQRTLYRQGTLTVAVSSSLVASGSLIPVYAILAVVCLLFLVAIVSIGFRPAVSILSTQQRLAAIAESEHVGSGCNVRPSRQKLGLIKTAAGLHLRISSSELETVPYRGELICGKVV